MKEVRVIEINESVYADNERSAAAIREMLAAKGVLFLNFMSGPGSGKTTLLTALINRLKGEMKIGEMDVDIESSLDAQRVADATGVESVQIHNGGLCHVDADMVARALMQVDTDGLDLLILENIGNLVCPAEFDTGAHRKIALLSVPEGHDKPLKYPLMFETCDLILITKMDTVDFFDFDVEKARQYIHEANPQAEVILTSAKTGEGLEKLVNWIRNEKRKLS